MTLLYYKILSWLYCYFLNLFRICIYVGPFPTCILKPQIEYICYVSPVLTTLKTVRYTKRTCTLAKFHIVARYTKILNA